MTIIASPLQNDVKLTYVTSLGDLHIFKNYIVAEYNEGLHLSFKDYVPVLDIIDKHFGSSEFGFIANRINPYSLVLTEAPKFQEALPSLKAYAIVYYTELARNNAELEKRFYTFNRENFDDLNKAVDWVNSELGITSG